MITKQEHDKALNGVYSAIDQADSMIEELEQSDSIGIEKSLDRWIEYRGNLIEAIQTIT